MIITVNRQTAHVLLKMAYKEVESMIQNAGLSLLEHQHFMAYEKSKERIPIYYTAVLARKLS